MVQLINPKVRYLKIKFVFIYNKLSKFREILRFLLYALWVLLLLCRPVLWQGTIKLGLEPIIGIYFLHFLMNMVGYWGLIDGLGCSTLIRKK
jgi:hypothetical protein